MILGAEWIRTACPPRHLCHYGDGFILTYDITNEESFNQIRKIKTEIEKELNKKDIPMTIVAMKTDLENQVFFLKGRWSAYKVCLACCR